MRTKTLLLTAALVAAGAATSLAQTVYSVNAVGYVNPQLGSPGYGPGFTMIANPLIAPDNSVQAILANAPDGANLLFWDETAQTFQDAITYYGAPFNSWKDSLFVDATNKMEPGYGAFINVAVPYAPTFVGEVPQTSRGNLPTRVIPVGFSIISQLTPQELVLDPTPGASGGADFPAADGDNILFYSHAGQTFLDALTYYGAPFDHWKDSLFTDVDPKPKYGESVFYNTAVAKPWTRIFNVSP